MRSLIRISLKTAALILLLGPAMPAITLADQTVIPVMSQAGERDSRQLPNHGQSQDAVRQSFGTPEAKEGPVGEPPISQWIYPDFVVYFEANKVIHAVLKPNR